VTGARDFWAELERPGPESALVDGVELRRGSRVVLRPGAGGDGLDVVLAGRVAVVEGVDEDAEGKLHLSVTLEDDPGRELGDAHVLGHRFFFRLDEVEPLAAGSAQAAAPRVLVACVGNIFLGDDAFGVEVAARLAGRPLPAGVEVVDFGIRGLDLAYALQGGYDAVILVDAAPRGEQPGTLSVVEPELGGSEAAAVEAHAMDPVRVLALARSLGPLPERIRLVTCEPASVPSGAHDDDLVGELSEPVRAAVERAVPLVTALAEELTWKGGEE
jgi:hydrogenase maturation protease